MERLDLFARLWLAFWLPWKLLFDGVAAARVERAVKGEPALPPAPVAPPAPVPPPAPVAAPPPPPAKPDPAIALHLLAVLQREGRLLDFLQEELTGVPDAQVGAAARVVHEGCRKAVQAYVTLAPVRNEPEGAAIAVPAGFDPVAIRLTGNVVGSPPFSGRLAHPGWRAAEVRLAGPPAGHDATILAPAEVEL